MGILNQVQLDRALPGTGIETWVLDSLVIVMEPST